MFGELGVAISWMCFVGAFLQVRILACDSSLFFTTNLGPRIFGSLFPSAPSRSKTKFRCSMGSSFYLQWLIQGHYPRTPGSNPLKNSMGLTVITIIYQNPTINRCCLHIFFWAFEQLESKISPTGVFWKIPKGRCTLTVYVWGWKGKFGVSLQGMWAKALIKANIHFIVRGHLQGF